MKDWELLGVSTNGIDLEIQKSALLENCQIQAIVINKKVSGYELGNWELYVHQSQAEAAKEYLTSISDNTKS
ncbi:MAG: hypothetical protein ACKOWQ_05735 [Aquirufa sp.]